MCTEGPLPGTWKAELQSPPCMQVGRYGVGARSHGCLQSQRGRDSLLCPSRACMLLRDTQRARTRSNALRRMFGNVQEDLQSEGKSQDRPLSHTVDAFVTGESVVCAANDDRTTVELDQAILLPARPRLQRRPSHDHISLPRHLGSFGQNRHELSTKCFITTNTSSAGRR